MEAPSNTEAEYTADGVKPIASGRNRQQAPANGGKLQQLEEAPGATPILPPCASAGKRSGSAWDLSASPERVIPDHLTEWVSGSAVAPELVAANVETINGRDVLEALAGDRLEQLGAHSQQYVTTGKKGAAPILRRLEPIAADGGWWCSGLDPLADWAPMAWGCFKPDAPLSLIHI